MLPITSSWLPDLVTGTMSPPHIVAVVSPMAIVVAPVPPVPVIIAVAVIGRVMTTPPATIVLLLPAINFVELPPLQLTIVAQRRMPVPAAESCIFN